jgi:uncharacterized membrane protein HdeD (DUF308 family)
MFGRLAQHWWILVLRGIVGILFGILAFVYPRDTVAVLVILLGAYMLVDGVTALVMAFHVDRGSGWLALSGMAGIGVGYLTLFYPVVTVYALLYIIAAWAIVTGIFESVAAIEFRRTLLDTWLLGLAGALSIALGFLLAAAPDTGLISLVWLLGGYALVFGILYVIAGFRLRGTQRAVGASRGERC